ERASSGASGKLLGHSPRRRLRRVRAIAGAGRCHLAACWIHMRRHFYEFFEATNSPVAAEALRRIGELYAIQQRILGPSPWLRLAGRGVLEAAGRKAEGVTRPTHGHA